MRHGATHLLPLRHGKTLDPLVLLEDSVALVRPHVVELG
ncbi:hypothetical protein GRAN_0500 [Granulicella sibirica]|uniref:Uncharacterized protein n=1 Tax=Granulicella sibirica TaxID=2479048 RepID=A0A4Q0T3U3_9BACT|nr:hypothetical protein GRAN_0500 [Granulicella sibirica]